MNKRQIGIASQLKSINYDDALEDLINLMKTKGKPYKTIMNSNVGNKYLDYFFFPYRLDTISRKGINFYDFYEKKMYLMHNSWKTFEKYNKTRASRKPVVELIYDFFRLYYGSINQFKPVIASYIYNRFKPNTVLDFSAGWGGRMLGTVMFDNMKYIGFDTNKELRKPYNDIIKSLGVSNTVKLYFKDSSKADFSKFDYDMVFTSPPYYNTEIYSHMKVFKTKDEWLNHFLYPVVLNSFKNMKKGGTYILNIPTDIYEDVKKILGPCMTKIELPLRNRHNEKLSKKQYKEYIYIWKK